MKDIRTPSVLVLLLAVLVGCQNPTTSTPSSAASPAGATDADAVASAKASLNPGYGSGDSASSVTQNLELPVTAGSSVSVTWTSSAAAVVSATGVVVRPLADETVTLTATLAKGSASDTKAFALTVKAAATTPGSSAAEVLDAKASLEVGYASGDTASAVTGNLALPGSGATGVLVTWSSSLPSVVTASGILTRPSADTAVTLTATLSKGTSVTTKVFLLTVKAAPPDPALAEVAAAKAALAVGFGTGDSATSVTQTLTLPTSGSGSVLVSWRSSDPTVLSNAGTPSPGATDRSVTMTATLVKGTVTDTKAFGLTVKADGGALADVAAAKAALALTYATGDSSASVTRSLGLPAAGSAGVSVTWESSNSGAVFTDGTVVRHAWDIAVTLTATLTKRAVSDTKAFSVTVPGSPQAIDTSAADVAGAWAAVAIGYQGTDTAAGVQNDLVLPASANGVPVAWSSSDPAVIATDGTFSAPASFDETVTLTASFREGSASGSRSFPVKALANPAVVGGFVVPAGVSDFANKKYALFLDNDPDPRNGQVAVIMGTATGPSVSYEFRNIAPGNYFVYVIIDATGAWGSASSGPASDGQYFGIFNAAGSYPTGVLSPNVTVAAGGPPIGCVLQTWVYVTPTGGVNVGIE
jgi:hypothetical protein